MEIGPEAWEGWKETPWNEIVVVAYDVLETIPVSVRATRRRMGSRIIRQMHQLLRDVAKDYELNHSPQEKPLMDVEDVREVYRRL